VVSVTCSAEWPLHHSDLNVSQASLIPLSLRPPTTLLSSSRYLKTSCLIYSHRPQKLTPFSESSAFQLHFLPLLQDLSLRLWPQLLI